MAAPVASFDLSTLIPERPRIRIDRTVYHLRAVDELTLVESFQFTRWGKQIDALEPSQVAELEALLVTVARAALADVPAEVFDRLQLIHTLSIVSAFYRSGQPSGGAAAQARKGRPIDWSEAIPRLQIVYGGEPSWWLHRAPAALLRAYLKMLPRLEAQRELASINAMAAAFGGMSRMDRSRYLGRLQQTARGTAPVAKATPEVLAAMGVGVVIVPAKEAVNG